MTEPTPLRPDEQVAGGFLAMRLGNTEHTVPVLAIRANREWKRQYATVLEVIVAGIGTPETIQDVAESINSHVDSFLDMLIAYDQSKALPDREWIDTHATDGEVYTAIQQVTNAAFPLVGSNLLELALMQSAQKVRRSLRSTNGSPPSTEGTSRRRKASKAA